ncbi:MAG: DUF167 family protein [Hyphomonadaceae bacterium]
MPARHAGGIGLLRAARLAVRLTPNAGANRIDGLASGPDGAAIVKARVSAPPEGGKANAALAALLAKALGVAKSRVRIARGAQARIKEIEIEGVTAAALAAFAAALPAVGGAKEQGDDGDH